MTNEEKISILEGIAYTLGSELEHGYSGRCMYGRECVGIVTHDPTGCIQMARDRGITGATTDNMGKDYIVYWPDISGGEE